MNDDGTTEDRVGTEQGDVLVGDVDRSDTGTVSLDVSWELVYCESKEERTEVTNVPLGGVGCAVSLLVGVEVGTGRDATVADRQSWTVGDGRDLRVVSELAVNCQYCESPKTRRHRQHPLGRTHWMWNPRAASLSRPLISPETVTGEDSFS